MVVNTWVLAWGELYPPLQKFRTWSRSPMGGGGWGYVECFWGTWSSVWVGWPWWHVQWIFFLWHIYSLKRIPVKEVTFHSSFIWFIFIGVQFTTLELYNVVFVSAVHWSEAAVCMLEKVVVSWTWTIARVRQGGKKRGRKFCQIAP